LGGAGDLLMATGTAVAIREVTEQLESQEFRAQIAASLPLPDQAAVDRFVRVGRTALIQNPDLALLERGSVLTSFLICSQLGLLPDGREAAIVPFKNKAVPMPMIGGLRKIAAQHGFRINAQVVYDGDEFDYELAPMPKVTHRPPPLGQERGEMIGAYAVAEHPEHGQFVEVMSWAEIERVRAVSRSGNTGAWKEWPGEMARKTVARRLWKQLPFADWDERSARVIETVDEDTVLKDVPPALPASVPAEAAFEDSAPADPTLRTDDPPPLKDAQGEGAEQSAFEEMAATARRGKADE